MKISQQTYRSLTRMAWVAGILLFVLIITSAVERKKEMLISDTIVEVEPLDGENLLIDSADVITIINRKYGSPLNDQPSIQVDEDRLESILEEDPFVKNAEVVLTANGKLKILIEQRKPVLRIFDGRGNNYYLDESGAKIPPSRHFTTRTLVANGEIQSYSTDFLQRKNHPLKDLFELALFILHDDFWNAQIEQIYVNNKNEFVLIPKVGDQSIIFGDYDNVEDKFNRLKVFYEKAISKEGWRKYHSIDLRFRGQVVCERND